MGADVGTGVDDAGRRCVRCDVRLARDNREVVCAGCGARERGVDGPPQVPADFWNHLPLRRALSGRHIGKVIRAWRYHPWHGRHPVAQTVVASWCGMSQPKLSQIENGKATMHLDRLYQWARLLQIPANLRWFLLPEENDQTVTPSTTPSPDPNDNGTHSRSAPGSVTLDRRALLRAGSPLACIAVSAAGQRPTGTGRLIAALLTSTGHTPNQIPPLEHLQTRVAAVRHAYQHSRYHQALNAVPDLLAAVRQARTAYDGDQRRLLDTMVAAVHQVASGLLLKFDEPALASVAADRAMNAARRSGHPLAVASSARAVVHTLSAAGHPIQAINIAVTAANQLGRDTDNATSGAISVYGALTLRAAVAAAQVQDRHKTQELLDEADQAAHRLGRDDNQHWTAFGPTNVTMHRVSAAVRLGDAGTAVDLAATINLHQVPIAERRATLLIDTAKAFTQWGKHDKALDAIQDAEQHAPEEVRARKAVHRLLSDITHTCPPSTQRRAIEYAQTIGAPV